MQRITISLDDDLYKDLEALKKRSGYATRSEVFRDFIREQLRNKKLKLNRGDCTAIVSYSYNSLNQNLAEKIIAYQHENSSVIVSALHIYAPNDECIEILILQGKVSVVRRLGEATIAIKGIRHGSVHIIPDKKKGVA